MDKPIEMPFGTCARVGPSNRVLSGSAREMGTIGPARGRYIQQHDAAFSLRERGHSPFAGLSSAIRRTFVQHFTSFQLTTCSRGPSATAGLLVSNYFDLLFISVLTYIVT